MESKKRVVLHWQGAVALCMALFGSMSAWAENEFESQESIVMVVKNHLEGWYKDSKYPVETKVDKLDPRLKMSRCSAPLVVSTSQAKPKKGRVFVTVSCIVQKPWKIFVPATIIRYEDIVAMTSSVSRNQVIKKTDVELRKTNLSLLPRGYFARLQDVVGKIAKRDIYVNTVLGPAHLKSPNLVKRGSRVTIVSSSAGITIKSAGIALGNAEKGKMLRVRNSSSGRVVEGEVIGLGVIKVRP